MKQSMFKAKWVRILMAGLAVSLLSMPTFAKTGDASWYGYFGKQLQNISHGGRQSVSAQFYASMYNAWLNGGTPEEYAYQYIYPQKADTNGDGILSDEEMKEVKRNISKVMNEYLLEAAQALAYDYPNIYWLVGENISAATYNYSGTPSNLQVTIKSTTLDVAGGNVDKLKTLNKAIDDFASHIDLTGDRYNQVKNIHDYIIQQFGYNQSAQISSSGSTYNAAHTTLGAFLGDGTDNVKAGNVVCEGYAKAFKVLCDRQAIPCILVSGEANNGKKQQAHMWNYVQMEDNNWYLVDVTWDDPILLGGATLTDKMKYKYFLIGKNADYIGNTTNVGAHSIPSGKLSSDTMTNKFTYPKLSKENYVYVPSRASQVKKVSKTQ